MQMLSIKFNHKAPKTLKEIKTEDDIKVGKRSDGAGGTMWVRGGKVVNRVIAKLNEFRHAATEAAAKQARASQEHHKPAHVQPERPPTL